jgi:hypothetical protein
LIDLLKTSEEGWGFPFWTLMPTYIWAWCKPQLEGLYHAIHKNFS